MPKRDRSVRMMMKSRTHEDYGWPRVVPLVERPPLPPLNTGIRMFCPKPDPDICKQDDFQANDSQLDCCKPAKFDHQDDDVLMDRQKFMLLNEALTCKPIAIDKSKLKSTQQIDYPSNKLNYNEIKNRLQVPKDEATVKQCLTNRSFHDPFPFKKYNDNIPLIG